MVPEPLPIDCYIRCIAEYCICKDMQLTVQLGVYAVLGGEPIASSNRDDAVIERGTNTIY